jgi:hypothetical protein
MAFEFKYYFSLVKFLLRDNFTSPSLFISSIEMFFFWYNGISIQLFFEFLSQRVNHSLSSTYICVGFFLISSVKTQFFGVSN